MFDINWSGLDDAIDERIDESWDIANNCPDIIDDKTGRLKCPMNFHIPRGNLLGIIQRQQEQIDEQRIHHELLWKRFEILKEECDKKL
jgi:hypothetical protein